MQGRQRHYLEAMGISMWRRRDAAADAPEAVVEKLSEEASPVVPEAAATAEFPLESPLAPSTAVDHENIAPIADTPEADAIAALDWDGLRQRVGDCRLCPELVASRTQTVFGVGNEHADWLIIGEAPGADEDRQGEPFVGRAGQLLNLMLQAAGKSRDEVYIANILKCRPPNNRDPHADEALHCEAFLKRQIALIQPKLILVVGRIAAHNLLKVDTAIGRLRGQLHHTEEGIPVVVTYHPAYLLRSPAEKRKSWVDLKMAMALAGSKR